MPSRHSKNTGDRHHHTYNEKIAAGIGTIKQRVGTDSQLPFGYCALSMQPAKDPVVSPSGHLYDREAILEYILNKTKEIKRLNILYQEQEATKRKSELEQISRSIEEEMKQFEDKHDGAVSYKKRKFDTHQAVSLIDPSKKKLMDDTDHAEKLDQLKAVCPWIPLFTPNAEPTLLKEPPKRPQSPYSQRPLRSKDLVPINLIRESTDEQSSTGSFKYVCPVSRKTITSQKVVLIKKSNTIMLESAFIDFALPTMTCPVTGTAFSTDDIIYLRQAATGFAASGKVEATVYRPNKN